MSEPSPPANPLPANRLLATTTLPDLPPLGDAETFLPAIEAPIRLVTGSCWIGFWTDGVNGIGFHGTPDAETVRQAASHGCIRMYNEDVAVLFDMVKVGTPVSVLP